MNLSQPRLRIIKGTSTLKGVILKLRPTQIHQQYLENLVQVVAVATTIFFPSTLRTNAYVFDENNFGKLNSSSNNISGNNTNDNQFVELESIGDEDLFIPEEACVININDNSDENYISFKDVVESKESFV